MIYFIYKRKDLRPMKKIKSLLALLLLGGLVATGCGNKDKTSDGDGSQQLGGDGSGSQGGTDGGGNQQGGEGGNQQGGEGGNGGQQGGGGHEAPPENSRFVNKKLRVDTVTSQPSVPAAETSFANGYIALFNDGTCEFVSPHDDTYDVLFGTFTVNDLDNIASITLYKMYLGDENSYSWSIDTDMEHLNLEYSNNQFTTSIMLSGFATTLSFTLVEMPNPPMHIVGPDGIPEDPNGYEFNKQYQVEEDYWNQFFKNEYLYRRNFTVNATVPLPIPGQNESYIVEVEDYRIHLNYPDYPAAEQYFQINSFIYENEEIVGINCDVYSKDGEEWHENDGVESFADRFQDYFGFLPIPFMSTSYSQFTHEYTADEVTFHDAGTDYQSTVYDFKVSFEGDGIHSPNIKKITYQNEIRENCEFNFSKHGQTTVELPNASGGGGGGGGSSHSQNASDYYSVLANTQFVFNRATGDGWTNEQKAATEEVFENGTISLFSDRTAEINTPKTFGEMGEILNSAMTQYGTYELTQVRTDNVNLKEYVRGDSTFNATLLNGEYTVAQSGQEMEYVIRYYIDDQEIRVTVQDGQYLYFTKTNNTPTPTAHPEPVFVPQLHYGYGSTWTDEPMPASGPYLAKIEHFYLYENEEFYIQLETDRWLHYEDYNSSPDLAGGMIAQGSEAYGTHNFLVLENGYYDIRVNDSYKVIIEHETSGGGGADPQPVVWPTTYITNALTAWGITNDVVPTCDLEGVTAVQYYPESVTDSDDMFGITLTNGSGKLDSYKTVLGTAGYSDPLDFGLYSSANQELTIYVEIVGLNLSIIVQKYIATPTGFPCIAHSTDGGANVSYDNMEYDSINDEYSLTITFSASEEFYIMVDENTCLTFEDYVDDRTANGAIEEGTEVEPGLHTLIASEAGAYSIYVTDSGNIYIVHGETQNIAYRFECQNDWDITVDSAVFYVWVWDYYNSNEQWIPLTVKGSTGSHYFEVNIPYNMVGAKIVRMDPAYGGPDWAAEWDSSDDLELSGTAETINFAF